MRLRERDRERERFFSGVFCFISSVWAAVSSLLPFSSTISPCSFSSFDFGETERFNVVGVCSGDLDWRGGELDSTSAAEICSALSFTSTAATTSTGSDNFMGGGGGGEVVFGDGDGERVFDFRDGSGDSFTFGDFCSAFSFFSNDSFGSLDAERLDDADDEDDEPDEFDDDDDDELSLSESEPLLDGLDSRFLLLIAPKNCKKIHMLMKKIAYVCHTYYLYI